MTRFPPRRGLLVALAAALLLAGSALAAGHLPDLAVAPRPLPAFPEKSPEAWLNTAPLTVADLKGDVVLIEVWTTV